MKKLTVILPFLNEGEEVYHTVRNLRETSNNDIDIILIDDHSTDGYDYFSIAHEFNTIFVKHDERQGVALSREEGIDKSETDFFILMDAHMRFYQNDWVQIITGQLEKDRRCLFCCQTVILRKDEKGNVNKEPHSDNHSFGAYVDFSDNNILNAKWNLHLPAEEKEIFDIPCVLGATYACNKSYWQKLKGLQGLRSYGLDETLISLKVWLEGGTCKLISHLRVGHIYRDESPYPKRSADYIFNQLYIAELFFNYTYKYKTFNNLRDRYPYLFEMALKEMDRNRGMIEEHKKYYQEIAVRSIEEVKKLNDKCRFYSKYNFLSDTIPGDSGKVAKTAISSNLFSFLKNNQEDVRTPGLLNGKAGVAVALAGYFKKTDPSGTDFCENLVERIYEEVNTGTPLNFADGLTGIAFGMDYIIKKAGLDIDIAEFFEDIDKNLITAINRAPLLTFRDDPFFSAGLYYLIRKNQNPGYFDDEFLIRLIKFCEEELALKLTFLKNEILPDSLYYIFSVLTFLDGMKSHNSISLTRLLDVTADYLVLLLPAIESATEKIAANELIQRVIVSYPEACGHWSEIIINDGIRDVLSEIENKSDTDLFMLVQKVGVYNLLFGGIVNKVVTDHLTHAVIMIMQDRRRWQEAGFALMDHENYSLKGLAGLSMIFSEQDV